jgi:hypothetical protein
MAYRLTTQTLTYKSILKLFFKVVYGNNEYYPDAVRWIKLKVSKDKQRRKSSYPMTSSLQKMRLNYL